MRCESWIATGQCPNEALHDAKHCVIHGGYQDLIDKDTEEVPVLKALDD